MGADSSNDSERFYVIYQSGPVGNFHFNAQGFCFSAEEYEFEGAVHRDIAKNPNAIAPILKFLCNFPIAKNKLPASVEQHSNH